MKDEEEYQLSRLRPYEIDPTRGIGERKPQKYIDNDRNIRQLIIDYDNDQNKDNPKLITLLHALQYRIGEKGFEDWN